MEIQLLALGRGGGNIARSFDRYIEKIFYMNSHREEMDLLEGEYYTNDKDDDVINVTKLCIDGGGTGRSPNFGERLAGKYRDLMTDFIEYSFSGFNGIILVVIGGGGGSGTGFAPTVCEILTELNMKFGIIYTLPLKQEGSPTVPNAINGLKTLVTNLKGSRVAPFFIIDNEMLFKEGKKTANYWDGINERIAKLMLFTELAEEADTDIGTFNTLDSRELQRIFRMVKHGSDIGFNDMKSFDIDIDNVGDSFKYGMKETSLSMIKGFDYPSAEGMLVVVERPRKSKDSNVEQVNELFELIFRRFRGKKMLKSVVMTDAKCYRMNILFSGMNPPSYINKVITSTKKMLENARKKRVAKATVVKVRFDDEFVDY